MTAEFNDDNQRILDIIKYRMKVGQRRYGHGMRIQDDTTQYGTQTDSWTEMGLEEILDLVIYLSAQILRRLDDEAELQTETREE